MRKSKVFEKIYPDDFVNLVREAGNAYSENIWNIGFLSLIAFEKLSKVKSDIVTRRFSGSDSDARYILAYTKTDLYRDLARNFGLSLSRVFAITSVTSFFDEGIIEKYSVLPFSHFEYAKSMGDFALEILEYDYAQFSRNGGYPESLEWLMANFSQYNIQDDLAAHDAVVSLEIAHDVVRAVPDGENVGVPASIHYFVRSAGKLIDSIEAKLLKMQMEDSTRERIFAIIDELRNLSKELDCEIH